MAVWAWMKLEFGSPTPKKINVGIAVSLYFKNMRSRDSVVNLGAGWLARLDRMSSSGLSKRPCVNSKDDKWPRKIPEISIRPSHTCTYGLIYPNQFFHMCVQEYIMHPTYTHTHTHMCNTCMLHIHVYTNI